MFILLVTSMLTLACNIQPVRASGTIYIRADGSIDPPTAPIFTLDNVTYTFTDNINDSIVIERDKIVVDGAGCTLQATGSGDGIDMTGRNNITIKNITIKTCYQGIYLSSSSDCSISGNNITENNDCGILCLSFSSNNSISGNNITNNAHGIYLYSSSSSNSITGNNITNNGDFIIGSSSNNTISGNNITNNGYGMSLSEGSNYNSIFGNKIGNNVNAILLSHSSCNRVFENDITNNSGHGVSLGSSENNIIYGNKLANNDGNGIELMAYYYLRPSSNNAIYGNSIMNNNIGVKFSGSSNNIIYHNDFIDNDQKVYDDYPWSEPSISIWDDDFPSGGNYWSDYDGTDADHDGIGDTAYIIYGNNRDNYPLMGVFSDFNATSEYHVQMICNSSISGFKSDDASISFNVTGEEGTAGFCRICIPTALINATYRVFVNGTEVSYNLLPCSNETYSYLYFNYTHSTQDVIIIPEFPSFLILPLFTITTLLATIVYRRKGAPVK